MSHIRTHVEQYRLLLIQQARKYVLDEKLLTGDFFRFPRFLSPVGVGRNPSKSRHRSSSIQPTAHGLKGL